MKATAGFAAILALAQASPVELNARQPFDPAFLDALLDPNPASKRDLSRRTACVPEPTGNGPIPSPDTAAAFQTYDVFANEANTAQIPTGYDNTFTNLLASYSGATDAYMGYYSLDQYSPQACADICNEIDACLGFNIYFERDPTVNPGSSCPNPPSTTFIKCVLWSTYLSAANALNTGQYRDDFQVVIAGSNGYVKNTVPAVFGYTGTYLADASINAPLCNGDYTYMGYTMFTDQPFDPALCGQACTAQNEYNLAHPPATGKPMLCQFFNTYLLMKNGYSQGQICAMYNTSWGCTYADNYGYYYGSDHYTISLSFSYSNSSDPSPCT